jgi:streptogramin lyase
MLVGALVLSGCGGGGSTSGGPSGALPPAGPSPVATGGTSSVSKSVAAQPYETSVQLPPIDGFTATIDLPPASGSGTITVTASTAAPAGVTALSQIVDYTSDARNPKSANAMPLIYISFSSDSPITVKGSPGFAIALPSSVDPNGRIFYIPRLEQQSWAIHDGPAWINGPGPYVKMNPSGAGLLLGTASVNFALAFCDLASIDLQLAKPLAAGTPSTAALTVYAQDALGYLLGGSLSYPITFSLSDNNGATSLQTTSVSNLSTPVQIAYNGKLDRFSITSTYQSVTSTQTFTSTLPSGVPLSGGGIMEQFVLGSDGNFWTPVLNGVARVSASGQYTYFADPNSSHAGIEGSGIAEGSDGNVWFFYMMSGTTGGIDRVTPSGQFTSFPFANTSVAGGFRPLVRGPDGALYFPGGSGVARIDTSGAMGNIASTPSLSYLVLGPDNNLWGSSPNGLVYKITVDGQVSSYSPSPGSDALDFVVGPDGNFWAPYAHQTATLVKFNTQGQLVSQTPLEYAPSFLNPPPYPTPTVPQRLGDVAKDSSGNIYIADPHFGGAIRITPSGSYSEYPGPLAGQDQPIDLLFANGTLYVSYMIYPLSGSGTEQSALATVDPSLW